MKLLLVNNQNQLVRSLEQLEQYDSRKANHLCMLLDLLEDWITLASAQQVQEADVQAPGAGGQ